MQMFPTCYALYFIKILICQEFSHVFFFRILWAILLPKMHTQHFNVDHGVNHIYLVFFILFQALAPQKVDRDAYDGAVASVVDTTDGGKGDATTPVSVAEDAIVPKQSVDQFHQRPPTRSGGRNMQESSFSFSGKFARL